MDTSLVIKHKRTTIAAAAVATLRATPVTLVPAPGSGKLLELVSGILRIVYTAPAYTESTDNLVVRYTDGSGVVVSQTIEMTSFITLTADNITSIKPVVDGIVTSAASLNRALVLHNSGDGEFGNSGGSLLDVWIGYRVWKVS
jgi:hypothetical protein